MNIKREKAIEVVSQLIVTLKALGEPYCTPTDIEALEFAVKNMKNTSTLKGMLIYDMTQCQIGGWKSRLEALNSAKVLFDKYLED